MALIINYEYVLQCSPELVAKMVSTYLF